jgi:hypothetical protein
MLSSSLSLPFVSAITFSLISLKGMSSSSLSLCLAVSLALSRRGALNFRPRFARMVQKKEKKKDKTTQLQFEAKP